MLVQAGLDFVDQKQQQTKCMSVRQLPVQKEMKLSLS